MNLITLKTAIISIFILTLSLTHAPAQSKVDSPPEGYFYIKSAQAQNQNAGYWDQAGNNASFKNGANIGVWAKDYGTDQKFRFVSAGSGFYYIVSQNGGYVDVKDGINNNGVNIHIWRSNKTASQKFRIKHIGNGKWKIYTAWGRAICLAGRSHNNGTNIHTWANQNGAWMEWYFENASTGKIFKPEIIVPGIQGTLEAFNYNSNGAKTKVNPGQSDIEVWTFNPSAPKEKYIKKKTVKTDSKGSFNLGTEFDNESSIFLLSKKDDRSSSYIKLYPKSKGTEIKDFVSEKYDSNNYVLVDTFHRGKQYYQLDNGYFYLKSGIVSNKDDFFFPNKGGITRTNSQSAKLLAEIKAGPAAKNDTEITKKLESVFQFIRTKTKSSMGTKDQSITNASNDMFSKCRKSPTHGLSRWPTFDEYAATYSKYGFIPTGNCTAWSHLTATLLYAAGVPADKFFVAKFNYDMSWIVEHWVIGLNIGDRWYSLDPQHNGVLKFASLSEFNNPIFSRDRGEWDYKRPFEAVLLPGSTISKIPYLGDPADLHKMIADLKKPEFFIKNKVFEYSSSTMVNRSIGGARVKSINGNDVTIEIDTITTGEGPKGFETKQHSFEMLLTHKKDGLYTSGQGYVYNGKVDSSEEALRMSGEQSGFTLKAVSEDMDIAFLAFFNSFKDNWQKGVKASTSADIVFPLTFMLSFEGSGDESKLSEADFFNEVRIKEPFMYPLRYEVDGENVILVHYGYEAQHFSLFFHRIKGKWKLVRVNKSED